MATKATTDANFSSDVLEAGKPVLVDFWAEWCGPCKMIAPALEELAEELGDQVQIIKLDIDENPDAPTKYGVRGIPTMILFKDGQPPRLRSARCRRAGSRSGSNPRWRPAALQTPPDSRRERGWRGRSSPTSAQPIRLS
jgi:thioredoxin 1